MHKWLIAIGLSLCAAAQAAPPARVEIAYEVMYNDGVVADVTHLLEHNGAHYTLTERWKGRGVYALAGDARRTSRGTIAADGLRPLEYEDVRSRREPARASFDWASENADAAVSRRAAAPADAGTCPGPAQLLPTRSLSARQARRRPSSTSSTARAWPTTSSRTRAASASGSPAGEFDALRLVKRKESAGDRSSELWLDPARSYLPLRVLVVQKDGTRYRPGRCPRHAPGDRLHARSSRARKRCSASCCRLPGPADAAVSRYFRAHRNLGQQDRAFVAETVYRGVAPPPLAGGCRAIVGAARPCHRSAGARARAFGARAGGCAARRRSGARVAREGGQGRGFPARRARGPARLAVADDSMRCTARTRRCASRRACSIPLRSTCASILPS